MPAARPIADRILQLARSREVFRPRDLVGIKNPGPQLRALVESGRLLRVGHGLYTLSDREPTGSFALSQALARVPGGVVCLVSSLEFHGLTTQIGNRVWLAVGDKRPLKVDDVPVRIVRMSGASFSEGIEEHGGPTARVRVYSAAKTVADCFKFRRVVGLDVALEALREGWRERRFQIDELMRFARIGRVENLIRPYVEAVVA